MAEVVDRGFTAKLDCHYLLQVPDEVDERTPLIVTLHGFGGNAESMLKLTERLFERPPVIAALQGPNQFFLSVKARETGYGWITSRRPSESIRLHHEMVLHALEEPGGELRIPPSRRFLMGFSQSVALNYRFAASHRSAIRGVLAFCGGLPGDWTDEASPTVDAAVIHIAARLDEYYPPAVTQAYEQRLRQHAKDVEFHMIEGGHWIPESAKSIVAPWVERILA